jgi:hypothetical protein
MVDHRNVFSQPLLHRGRFSPTQPSIPIRLRPSRNPSRPSILLNVGVKNGMRKHILIGMMIPLFAKSM